MPNLKHYDEWYDKLKLYAKAIGLKVVRKSIDCEGEYNPQKKVIYIDTDLSDSEEIAVLLHELGHAVDEVFVNERSMARIDKAYRKVYTERCSKSDAKIVLRCERRAWKLGRGLAKKLNIRIGKWFDKFEKMCLNNYR